MLQLDGLKTYFHTEQGIVKAVDGLTIDIMPGRTLGLVGSGSGNHLIKRHGSTAGIYSQNS